MHSPFQRKKPSRCRQSLETCGHSRCRDAFVSGLLAGLAQTPNWHDETVLVEVIRKANASGALATTAKGAMSALPNKAELDAFFGGIMMAQVSTLVPHFLQKGTSVDACTIVISEMTGTLMHIFNNGKYKACTHKARAN